MAGGQRLYRIVNETEVHDLNAGAFELFPDRADVAFEARLEPFELRPVSVKADAEQSDAESLFHNLQKTRC